MSEPVNALGGAVFDGLVRITEMPPRGMITLKGDLSAAKLKDGVAKLAGVTLPGSLEASVEGERGILWMAPDELLVLLPYGEVAKGLAALGKALKGTHHLAADVSDARSLFCIEGGAAREVLAKLAPVDFSPETFAPGHFRRTRLAQIPAAVWMRDAETFEVICFRSVARYAFDLLANVASADARVDMF